MVLASRRADSSIRLGGSVRKCLSANMIARNNTTDFPERSLNPPELPTLCSAISLIGRGIVVTTRPQWNKRKPIS
jgi:hypothetical protein